MGKSFYLKIIQNYNLEYYFGILLTKNKGVKNPYHNNYHTITVFLNSYHISKIEECDKDQIRSILIASIFHDFNHTGGNGPDSENIKIAIFEFKKYSKESEEINNEIINIIKATEYPYVIDNENLTLSQKIIRDADLTQMYTDNFLQQVIYGLLVQEHGLELSKALEAQMKFMIGIKPMTKYGQELYNIFFQKRIKDINYINKIIKNSKNV
jgi:hypothetical protein